MSRPPVLPRPLLAAVKVLAAVPALPLLAGVALLARRQTQRRRRAGARPRIVWGPVEIVAIKYWSQALQALGYESTTVVASVFDINERTDFDRLRADFGPRTLLFEPWRDHLVFGWALLNADIVAGFLDGGFLRHTALARAEGRLLRLAAKRLVVSPYGSDIAVRGHLDAYEQAMAADYPELIARSEQTRRRVDWFCANADVVIRNIQPGYLPRCDFLWPSQMAIDTGAFAPGERPPGGDGTDREVVVVHAPNHRTLKGTRHLIDAVEALRSEGLRVRLELLERRPNEDVRRALASADVLAEQFLLGFGLLAVEGMASGAAVITRLSWMPAELRAHPAVAQMPVVDADAATLTQRLRELVTDPARRAALGAAGRRHVLRWHSYAAVGRTWSQIFEAVWSGAPVPRAAEPLDEPEGTTT